MTTTLTPWLVSLAVLAAASSAAAQSSWLDEPGTPAATYGAALDDGQPARDALLRSIESESHSATALYVTAVVELIGSPLALIVGFAESFGCVADAIHDSGSGRCFAADALYITSAVLGLAGLLTLPVAIGLDVDSGSRRRGLDVRVALDASPSSGGLAVIGTF